MQHNAKAKAQARDAYTIGGAAYAAHTTGIPLRTIQRWAQQGGWVHEPTAQPEPDARNGADPAWNGHKKSAAPSAPSLRRLGQRYLQEASALLDAARDARERHRPRDAREFMTGSAIAADKARQAGATEQDSAAVTPEELEVRRWAYLEKHKQVMDAAAGRQQDEWEAHLRHPNSEYVERVRYQRRLMELLEAGGYSYPQAMRQLRAEGWS